MSTELNATPRPLPERPNLRHLKDQAKDLLATGKASSLADAQFQIARLYAFVSWPKLNAHVEPLEEVGKLRTRVGIHADQAHNVRDWSMLAISSRVAEALNDGD